LPGDYKERIMSQLGRIGDAVPAAIELGYHLCYGSPADQHLVLPEDMGILVEMANGITRAVTRQVHFIHMPVPKDRTDDAYFKPLGDLALGDATDLYLGLIHYQDEDGDRERLRIAHNYHRVAGISAECGWGRADPARVPGFLESHRKAVSG